MSQQHPQQPRSGHSQPPGGGTPPPKKTPVGIVVGLGCLGVVVFFALLGIVGSVIGDDSSSTSKGTSVSADADKGTKDEEKDDTPASDPEPSKTAKEDANSAKPEEPKKTERPSATADRDQNDKADARKAGIPPKPTGKERQALLDALAAAAPHVVRYEDKAIDAARNQCSAINGGAQRLNWSASQRFTYKDVVTSEAQGAKINKALKESGYCDV